MNKTRITCNAKDCIWAKPMDPRDSGSRICRCTSAHASMVKLERRVECITYEEKKDKE